MHGSKVRMGVLGAGGAEFIPVLGCQLSRASHVWDPTPWHAGQPGTATWHDWPLTGIGARPSQGWAPELCTEGGVSVSARREGGLRMLHGLSPLSLSPQPAALGSARPDPPSRPLPPDPVPKVTPKQGGGSLSPPWTRCMSGCALALGDFCDTGVPKTPPAQREAGSRAPALFPCCLTVSPSLLQVHHIMFMLLLV